MDNKEYIMNIEDLTVYYELETETVKAINNVSLKLEKGKTLGLVGETGAGKTTLALSLLRLVPDPPGVIKSGKIEIVGKNILSLSKKEMEKVRGDDVSMIFQDPMTSLNPVYTVCDQIAESIILHQKVSKHEAEKRAIEMLELVGIPADRAYEYPHQFSGGMKQRVMISIALACNPHLLIADEPTTALDVTIQAQVLDLMARLRDKYGTSVLMITHDLGVVAEICDEVAVMYAGSIVERGTLEEVFENTKHPYTEGLFNSLPDVEDRKAELKPIPGLMPDPTNLPVGCAFAPRCPYATAACEAALPSAHDFSATHQVVCTAYNNPDFKLSSKEDSHG